MLSLKNNGKNAWKDSKKRKSKIKSECELSITNIDLSDAVFKQAYEMIEDPLCPNLFITGGGG